MNLGINMTPFLELLNKIDQHIPQSELVQLFHSIDQEKPLSDEELIILAEHCMNSNFFREQLVDAILRHSGYLLCAPQFHLLNYAITHVKSNNIEFDAKFKMVVSHCSATALNSPLSIEPTTIGGNNNIYSNYYSFISIKHRSIIAIYPNAIYLLYLQGMDCSKVNGSHSLTFWASRCGEGAFAETEIKHIELLYKIGILPDSISKDVPSLITVLLIRYLSYPHSNLSIDKIKKLVQGKYSLNHTDAKGDHLLHYLVKHASADISATAYDDVEKILMLQQVLDYIEEKLLKYQADNLPYFAHSNKKGESPLHYITNLGRLNYLNLFANQNVGWQQKSIMGENVFEYLVKIFSLKNIALYIYKTCPTGFFQSFPQYIQHIHCEEQHNQLMHNTLLHTVEPQPLEVDWQDTGSVYSYFSNIIESNSTIIEMEDKVLELAKLFNKSLCSVVDFLYKDKLEQLTPAVYYEQMKFTEAAAFEHKDYNPEPNPVGKYVIALPPEKDKLFENSHRDVIKYFYPYYTCSAFSYLNLAWQEYVKGLPLETRNSLFNIVIKEINHKNKEAEKKASKEPTTEESKKEQPIEPSVNSQLEEDTVLLYTDNSLERLVKIVGEEEEGFKQAKNLIKELEKEKTIRNKTFAKSSQLKAHIATLREQFPHFNEVLDHVENHCTLQEAGNGRFFIPPMLLAGGPGVGKTFFSHTIAQLVETYFHVFHMESMTASWVLTGLEGSWGGSKPGQIFTTLKNEKKINPIFLLDELDKLGGSYKFSPENSLLPLLERYTASTFKDECIPLEIDASHIVWIATANNIANISLPVQSRFDIFTIPSPNFVQRKSLIKGIYKSVLANHTWGGKFSGDMSDTILDALASINTPGASRDLQRNLITACSKALRHNRNTIHLEDLVIIPNVHAMPWDITKELVD